MNKKDFGLLLENWERFLNENESEDKIKNSSSFNMFIESCIEIEKEIDAIRESLILESSSLKGVYGLNEAGLIDNFKKVLSGFKFRKDSGEKIDPNDPESQNKQVLTKASKAILILFITLKCSQAFAPTAHIDMSKFQPPESSPITAEAIKSATPEDIKQINKMSPEKIKKLAKSLPNNEVKKITDEVKKIIKHEVKKEVKKIKVNTKKANKLKSKKAKEKAKEKIKKASQEITKKTKKAFEDIKKTGIDYKAAEKELMDDPDVKEALDLAQNAPHGESGENVVNIEISEQTLQLKKAFKNIKSELNKFSANNEMKKIDNLSDHNDLSSVDDMLEEASNTTVSNLIQIAKIYAFKKAFSDSTFEKNILDHTIKTKLTEKTIDDKDSSDMKVSSKGNSESSFLAWLLQTANSTDSNEVLHDDYDAPGDGAYDKLTRDLDDNAKDYLDVENNPYYTDFKFAFEKACFAAAKGYKPAQKSVGVDYDAVESNVSVFIKGKTIGAIDADDSKKSK